MHRQTRPVSPLMRRLTRASCTRALFCTPAGLGGCIPYTPNLHKRAQNGRRNLRRQLGYVRLCRSRTGFSKLKRSARTLSSSHRCFRRRQTTRGIQRARLRARSLVLCHLVSRLTWKLCGCECESLICFFFTTATADGRALVAVGCAEGVWIGFRHDSRCENCVTVVSNRYLSSLQPCAGCCT